MSVRKSLKYILSAVMIFLVFNDPVVADKDAENAGAKLRCGECHTCEVPRLNAPCLKPCPRLFASRINGTHSIGEAPHMLVLDALIDQYEAVPFNHNLHASMSAIDKGCPECHHYSPAGKIPPCIDCHGGETNPANLRQPSLKGAYHRQCLGCHREWSHSTACEVCHLPRGQRTSPEEFDSTDIIGISHPAIIEPSKKVYDTPYKPGAIVTFFHKEHIDLFGLRCVECHQSENCTSCHDIQKSVRIQKTQEEIHAICSGCHGTQDCDKCHDTRERPGFSHSNTGWPLEKYHSKLDCNSCHPAGERKSKLEKSCAGCHGPWNQENFTHDAVGLALDEVHSLVDCAGCHSNNSYREKPDCSGCHDDNRDYKDKPPGRFIE